jgi:hypothetical protein
MKLADVRKLCSVRSAIVWRILPEKVQRPNLQQYRTETAGDTGEVIRQRVTKIRDDPDKVLAGEAALIPGG